MSVDAGEGVEAVNTGGRTLHFDLMQATGADFETRVSAPCGDLSACESNVAERETGFLP